MPVQVEAYIPDPGAEHIPDLAAGCPQERAEVYQPVQAEDCLRDLEADYRRDQVGAFRQDPAVAFRRRPAVACRRLLVAASTPAPTAIHTVRTSHRFPF